MPSRNNHGFTLVEMLIALAILAVTLNLAMPNFSAMMSRHESMTRLEDFTGAIALARTEALRTGAPFSVQAADPSDVDDEFGAGWCVVAGSPGNCNGTVLRQYQALPVGDSLDSIQNVSLLQFNSLGELGNAPSLQVDFCGMTTLNRRVFVSPIGRARAHAADDTAASKRPAC